MPSKKKKYNARFPAGRIKKIMQSDEEIGKVAQAVPVIISRTLELFVESLLTKTLRITNSRNARTLSPSHMKQCIMAENRFDFLRELVMNIPDISVAEEVSNDSSPEATIDPSDAPYDLSMPSTSSTNEVYTHKAMPSNGNLSLMQNNGVTRSCGTTIVTNALQLSTSNVGASEEGRAHLKREWDLLNRTRNQLQTIKTPNISSKSQSTESTPPKLFRTDSAPAGLRSTQIPSTAVTSLTEQKHHQQQQQPNQLVPTDLRRLRHQTVSVPGNVCAEAVSSQRNTMKPKTPTTAIPAPIVSIDFCNKPIVKIDYSNLALHDTNYAESPPSSSSSPTVEQTNCAAKIPLHKPTAESPVINIDLSNIVTSGTFSQSPLHPSVSSTSYVELPVPLPVPPANNKSSYLDLDEDYDNI